MTGHATRRQAFLYWKQPCRNFCHFLDVFALVIRSNQLNCDYNNHHKLYAPVATVHSILCTFDAITYLPTCCKTSQEYSKSTPLLLITQPAILTRWCYFRLLFISLHTERPFWRAAQFYFRNEKWASWMKCFQTNRHLPPQKSFFARQMRECCSSWNILWVNTFSIFDKNNCTFCSRKKAESYCYT